ncbi:hypothetical protein OAU50_00010 [Planctomycetota bacterium]|nr:hypothetical protein [Planctomycetota bacterium]
MNLHKTTIAVLLLTCQVVLVTGCNTTQKHPQPSPETVLLVDESEDTDFRLSEYDSQFRLIREYETSNNRTAAALILDTVRTKLPADYIAERQYVLLRLSALWGAQGEGQDTEKSVELLRGFRPHNKRVTAEYQLLQFEYADIKAVTTEKLAHDCLSNFKAVKAYRAMVNAGRVIANRYTEYGLETQAEAALRETLDVSSQLEVAPQHLYVCLDMGEASADDTWFNQAYITALKLEGEGWTTVVVATATDYWYGHNNMQNAASWGARIRTHELGEIPSADEAGLWPEDHALLLSQYALALHDADRNSRRRVETLNAAKVAMQGLPEEAAEWSKPWLEKLDAALLQAVGD